MHIGKSTNIALALTEQDSKWLAHKLFRSIDTANHLRRNKHTSPTNIEKLAEIFEMKVSEFIALGESK